MIFNLLKNLILALLLDAGAALAFEINTTANAGNAPPAATAAPQSCMLPLAGTADRALQTTMTTTDSGTRP